MSFPHHGLLALAPFLALVGCATTDHQDDGAQSDQVDRSEERRKHRKELATLQRQVQVATDEAKVQIRQRERLERDLQAVRETSAARKRALDAALDRLRRAQEELVALRKRANTPQTVQEAAALLRAKDEQIKALRAELALALAGKKKELEPNPNALVELASINFEKPVARIDNRAVTRREFAEFLYRDLGAPRLLDLFINRYLIRREARRRKIKVSDVDAEVWVGREINRQLKQAGSEERLDERLKGSGFTREAWEARLRYQSKPALMLQRLVVISRRSRDGKKAWEQRIREAYKQRYSERVQARHIYFKLGPRASKAEERDALRKADAAYRQIKSGVPFRKVALYHTDDAKSRQLGGSLGTFDHQEYAVWPRLNAAFFSLRPGQVSRPLRSALGYHIVLVDKRLPPARKFNEETRQKLIRELEQEAPHQIEVQVLLRKLRSKVPIEISLEFD